MNMLDDPAVLTQRLLDNKLRYLTFDQVVEALNQLPSDDSRALNLERAFRANHHGLIGQLVCLITRDYYRPGLEREVEQLLDDRAVHEENAAYDEHYERSRDAALESE